MNGDDHGGSDPAGPSAEERLAVSIRLHENFIVARAVGELDYASAGLLHRRLKDAWATTRSAGLVLDLGGLTFCDSRGIGVLVMLLRQSRDQQASLVLSPLPAHLERVLTMTGVRAALQVAASVEEAIQIVQASAPRRTEMPEPPGQAR
ncbi:hypothetical protein GCM10010149_91510 [Nonomuraea roseoviolacea subsp. roseoviolacea]|uniref:Anti-sigma factor antagonist n=1 Tax=Nonomuraea roseoviolacea subsp. carminata TaxID=160689 RepID=A0ABT1JRQ1_9ACTN|nr:STAS domain-containing protein [Nonomuraea roseoviolacea]MCP2344004.1 anti-anti-sigma factor [Nonomuraea roseoviolacea subsp. carminata]